MKLALPDSILSLQGLRAVALEIEDYGQWFGQSAVKQKVAGGQAAEPPVISEPAMMLIKGLEKDAPLSRESIDELVGELKRLLSSAPRIVITLAAPAPQKLKQTLSSWCRQNIRPDVLVDFKFNATILGGMVVSYGSHTYDWSFKRQILAAREGFAEVLRRV